MSEKPKREMNIHGNVQKMTQIGTVQGKVVIGRESNFLHQVWDNLEPELQDALSLAYNQTRRDGGKIIKTRYFFAALTRLRPEPLPELIKQISERAFPKPISQEVTTEKLILSENPELSGCIEDSLRHLAHKASPQKKLSSADMFVDIAKYGTGNSVARFRASGLTPEKVDEIVGQLGWDIIER